MELSDIIGAIRSGYAPDGIILHGSRALEKHRPSSDWDFVFVFSAGDMGRAPSGRMELGGENLEWKCVEANASGSEILAQVGPALRHAVILWEQDGAASGVLARAQNSYASGPNVTDDDVRRRNLFLKRRLKGLYEDRDAPHLFQRHLCIFHASAANWWFEILQGEFSEPFYLAIEIIRARDSVYADDLDILVAARHKSEVTAAATRIYHRLFGDVEDEVSANPAHVIPRLRPSGR